MPPPPWKKARLSRLVSDHLTSPTHGGSLVVETGFPTSLVDLFVKNRHRMKKSSSKKNIWAAGVESESAADIFETESVDSATTPRSPLDRRPVSESIPMNKPIDRENSGETEGGCDGRGAESKGYFWYWWWIFKVFFVVVLAMATKQLALGITVSAFSLLLVELFGKYVLKPWLHARKSLKNNNHSSSIESQSKEVQIEENDNNADSNVVETPNPKPNTHLRLPSGETWAMKSILSSPRFHRRSASDGTGTAKDLHAFKSFNLNWFSLEESNERVKKEDADNHSELDQIPQPLDQIPQPLDHDFVPNQIVHKSSSRKIKSKIKKLVKKLKSSKKERTDRRGDASRAIPPTESESFSPSINLNENNHEPQIDDATSHLTEDSHVTETEDNVLGLSNNNDARAVEGRKGLRRRKSTYCVAMFAVVLAGLVGGRFCSIAFTLIWCAVMKMIGMEGSIGKLSG